MSENQWIKGKKLPKEIIEKGLKTKKEKGISYKGNKNPNYKNLPLDEIEDLYFNKKLPMLKIGKIFNCERHCISHKIKKIKKKE